MPLRNQIVSYFVDPTTPPKVFRSPVTMNAKVASKIIGEEYGINLSGKRMAHICFDRDSKILYMPNANLFSRDKVNSLLQAVKYYVQKEGGDFRITPVIEGSPFSSLRMRSVSSFGYVQDAIKKHFKGEFKNLPVVEANLVRMPQTIKQLPAIYQNNKNYSGGLINDTIEFIDEIDIQGKRRRKPIHLLTMRPPFVLIDMSSSVESSLTQKEWAVLAGYRDYVMDNAEDMGEKDDAIEMFAPLYAAKRHLYLGWSFEEVCKVFLEHISDFGSLMRGINYLLLALQDLIEEGYDSPAKYNYYTAFKIDLGTFPLNFQNAMKQIPFFQIMEYDPKTGYMIICSPAYIESDLCLKVLKATSRPYIVKYNEIMKRIDVKVQESVHKELDLKTNIPGKIRKQIEQNNGIQDLQFGTDKRSRSISLSSNKIYNLRMLSDYRYAKDHIAGMCKKRGMSFEDVQVFVGPIERIFGKGVQGGFMGEKEFKKSKLDIPYQIEKGLYVRPPLISVNSETMPSYAAQTETLIHEYSHKLFSICNPCHKHLYNKDSKLKRKNPKKYWDLYLGDKDEKIAHKEEVRFELLSGKSVDEIVRDKVGGAITIDNYKQSYFIALKFKEIVDEVIAEIE